MIKRNVQDNIIRLLQKYGKMLFISGPRQVGKTTVAREILKERGEGLYFNWDIIKDQKKLIKDPYFFEKENRDVQKKYLVVFDEIHKYSKWKNYLKGVYDGYSDEFSFMVTGSGRLDLFKKGGDSLLGRYFSLPLFPLTLGELLGTVPDWHDFQDKLTDLPYDASSRKVFEQLSQFSGFPEPFLKNSEEFYNIWFQERKSLLIREDIRNAYAIRELSNMEVLSNILPERIGSPLSINALREDLDASFYSIKDWILILEQFYYLFRIQPFSKSITRSLKKEPKIYLYDWCEVPQETFKFENIIALHLFKAVNIWRALGQGDINLFYVRDKDKREVDFLIAEKDKAVLLIECKLNDENISDNLLTFQDKTKAPFALQVVNKKNVSRRMKHNSSIQWIVSAERFLSILP